MERRHLQLFDSRVMAPKNIEYFYKDEYAALNEKMTLKVKIDQVHLFYTKMIKWGANVNKQVQCYIVSLFRLSNLLNVL